MLALAAGNRDPRRWEEPGTFRLNRPRIKEHLAFDRGAHVCAGAPLARVEVRLILETLLEMTSSIDLVEEHHGPVGNRRLEYDPSFIIRGLAAMHLKLTPAIGFEAPAVAAPKQEAETKPRRKGLFGFGKAKDDAPTVYSTGATKLGALLADPAAKAVLDRHFPGVTDDPRIGMGKGMMLRSIQRFAPDMFTAEALDAVDAGLAKLPVA